MPTESVPRTSDIDSKTEDVRNEYADVDEKRSLPIGVYELEDGSLIDLYAYHQQRAGSLAVDPEYVEPRYIHYFLLHR